MPEHRQNIPSILKSDSQFGPTKFLKAEKHDATQPYAVVQELLSIPFQNSFLELKRCVGAFKDVQEV